MSDGKDELRQRFNQARDDDDTPPAGDTSGRKPAEEVDNLGNIGNTEVAENTENTEDAGDTRSTPAADDREDATTGYDWEDKYNYPLYVPREFGAELDRLYNQYDAKDKLDGGDGLEKHREFLFPIMQAAIEELELDEVLDWQVEE